MSMDEFVNTLSDEQKQALMKALSAEAVEKKEEEISGDFTMNKPSSKIQSQKRRESVRGKENSWTDTGEHRDIETPDKAQTPRNRPKPKKKQVKCHACGKTSTVNASLVYGEYYRCDRCTGR